jgi:hypothetical protein
MHLLLDNLPQLEGIIHQKHPKTKKNGKNDQKKIAQTFIISVDNCQTLVILAHNC